MIRSLIQVLGTIVEFTAMYFFLGKCPAPYKYTYIDIECDPEMVLSEVHLTTSDGHPLDHADELCDRTWCLNRTEPHKYGHCLGKKKCSFSLDTYRNDGYCQHRIVFIVYQCKPGKGASINSYGFKNPNNVWIWMGGWVTINPNIVRIFKSVGINGRSLIPSNSRYIMVTFI